MTVRDELERDLERAISVVMAAHKSKSNDEWDIADAYAYTFLRDHGPALLAMVGDAERYRWLRNAEGIVMLDDPEDRIYHDAADRAVDQARAGK